MAQLAEAYIHLRPFYVSAERLEALGKATDELARIAAVRFYDQSVEIEVELIEGTLWAKIKVTGGIVFAVYTGYASYDGAINTTEKLCKQANLFGDYVCSAFIKEAGAKKEQVVRVERRLKTPGKLRRALQRIKRLDNAAGRMQLRDLQRQLHGARLELEAAMNDLDTEEEVKLVETLTFRNLPPLKDWPGKDTQLVDIPRIATRVKDAQLSLQEDELIGNEPVVVPATRRRLHYHSQFVVSPPGGEKAIERKKPLGGLVKD